MEKSYPLSTFLVEPKNSMRMRGCLCFIKKKKKNKKKSSEIIQSLAQNYSNKGQLLN